MKILDLDTNGLQLVEPEILRVNLGDNSEHITFYRDIDKTIYSLEFKI